MTDLTTLHSWPELDHPVLVICLEGWIDAGQAAATAMTVVPTVAWGMINRRSASAATAPVTVSSTTALNSAASTELEPRP